MYNYPPQQQHNPNASMIPLNPGVALMGIVGQNTIQQNQGAYQNYNYPQPQFGGYPQQQQQYQPVRNGMNPQQSGFGGGYPQQQ
jgi:hypothetical protein